MAQPDLFEAANVKGTHTHASRNAKPAPPSGRRHQLALTRERRAAQSARTRMRPAQLFALARESPAQVGGRRRGPQYLEWQTQVTLVRMLVTGARNGAPRQARPPSRREQPRR